MPIRNYTSSVSPAKSAGLIQQIIAANGAHRVSVDYDGPHAVAITFMMRVEGRVWAFRLAPDAAGMLAAMKRDRGVPPRYCTPEQAARVAWKNELDWIDAQLAKVAAGQAKLEQLLLGYALYPTGETVFERIENDTRFLPESETVDGGPVLLLNEA